jgi:protoheme IX farnesyltransferase
MIAEKVIHIPFGLALKSKLRDYGQLVKFRLNLTVVFSTVIGFILGSTGAVNWFDLFIVALGGFLTVGAANGINQIIERDSDKLMKRTENRPLATNRMGVQEAAIACTLLGVAGVLLIGINLNHLSG